ncbi:hypothetical protein LNTAR_06469 [Lentisphaera araneosa HTCC2155]|jgi:hypothetical protein|uniref:Uncharacterized protein n=1 Tax=Lentisphaera araneosa HTCC2155 TaxID=313628 RepID=A6DNC0_9BACT|nr:hypothetical protein LNTAR_06469 [Lentisphaera araneosa HTCC2155]
MLIGLIFKKVYNGQIKKNYKELCYMVQDKYLTRQTLLIRAQNDDDQYAWDEFITS